MTLAMPIAAGADPRSYALIAQLFTKHGFATARMRSGNTWRWFPFQPGSDRLRDLYKFFKNAARGKLTFVWHPRGNEWSSLGDKVCAELGLAVTNFVRSF